MTDHAADSHPEGESEPMETRQSFNSAPTPDPFAWAPGKTFRDRYLDGEIPWREEPLLQDDRHPFEVVEEYLTLLRQYTRAEQESDSLALRRLTGELDAAHVALDHMDTFDQAPVLPRLTEHLTRTTQNPPPPQPTAQKRSQVLPERGRFSGPAPFFRRGRAYIQVLAPIFMLAAQGHGEFVSRRPDDADQLLRAVEASNDAAELQDFIAGAVHELHRQLRQLISHPTTESE